MAAETRIERVGILILDDDQISQAALRHVLDSEGWRLRAIPQGGQALKELASGKWNLVIANVALTGFDGPLFATLRELALAPPSEAANSRLRVLFLVPETSGEAAQIQLEKERLPYALKPLHLHDFLEKVSDLLLEVKVLETPLRRVRYHVRGADRRSGHDRRLKTERRETSMFAAREDYYMTEEEITDYERQEAESKTKRKKKEDLPY